MKRKSDTEGYKTDCYYYEPCPICYGCRAAFNYCSDRCNSRCNVDRRRNICTSPLHYPENFAKIMSRPKINLDQYK